MARLVRQSLIASLVAFYASVTLCGPCLHAAPGLGHGSGRESSAKAGPALDAEAARHASADTCPICQFLAHAQVVAELPCIHVTRFVFELTPPALPDVSQPPPHLPSCPRAPPVADGDVS